jgi:ACS family glucarate transporter-like MFS transporter
MQFKVLRHIELQLASKQRFVALLLMCMALAIAAGERSALSVAGPALSNDLKLNTIELGWLLSAFAWSYVVAHIPVGLVVEHYGTRRTIGLGMLLSAFISLVMAIAGATIFAQFALWIMFTARIMLGIVQAPIGSSSGIVMSAWFPKTERGVAGSIYSSMPLIAVAFLNPLFGYVADHHGWQAMFVTVAFISLLAASVWFSEFQLPVTSKRLRFREKMYLERGGALLQSQENRKNINYVKSDISIFTQLLKIFGNRMMGGFLVAQYTTTSITWFFVAWFPTFLVNTYGFSISEAASASAIPAIAGFLGGVCVGFISDHTLKRTGDLTFSRKLPVFFGMSLVTGVFALAPSISDPWLVIKLMAVAFFGKGVATMGWTITSDIAPANKIGLAGSTINAVGNISGIMTPIAIGYLVAMFGDFSWALYLMAAHGLVALLCHTFVIGELKRMEPIH